MARTIVKIASVVALAASALMLSSCYDARVSDFHKECEALGGQVHTTVPPGLFSQGRIDCIVNNEIVYLKGYN